MSLAVTPAILYACSAACCATASPVKKSLPARLTLADAAPSPKIHTGFLHKALAFSSLATITHELPSALAQQSPTRKGLATGPAMGLSGSENMSRVTGFRYTALSLICPYVAAFTRINARSSGVVP